MSAAVDALAREILLAMLDAIEREPTLANRIRTAFGAATPEPAPAHEMLYATAGQYAERMHVSLRTVRMWIADGLPTVGSGRTRRIDVGAADAWLAARSDASIACRARRDAARQASRAALRAIHGGAS